MDYVDIKFDEPIPKGYNIYYKIEVAGLHYRLDNAIAFVNGNNQSLELQREPDNPHDKYAIKVIGNVTTSSFLFFRSEKRVFLGYIPAEYARILADGDAYKNLIIRQDYAGASERGGKICFQLLGKKIKKSRENKQ